jgi:hypothetical protein
MDDSCRVENLQAFGRLKSPLKSLGGGYFIVVLLQIVADCPICHVFECYGAVFRFVAEKFHKTWVMANGPVDISFELDLLAALFCLNTIPWGLGDTVHCDELDDAGHATSNKLSFGVELVFVLDLGLRVALKQGKLEYASSRVERGCLPPSRRGYRRVSSS